MTFAISWRRWILTVLSRGTHTGPVAQRDAPDVGAMVLYTAFLSFGVVG